MNKIKIFNFSIVFCSSILLLVILSTQVIACECSGGQTPPCAAYEKADVVFIGKLKKITPASRKTVVSVRVNSEFEVKKTLKGEISGNVEVSIPVNDCTNYTLAVGETYFLYTYKNNVDNHLEVRSCDRTARIADANADIEYVSSLHKKSSSQSVLGEIWGLSEDALKKVRITMQSRDEYIESKPERDGIFNLKTFKMGKFQVVIDIPLKMEIAIIGNSEVLVETQPLRTIIKYEVHLDKNRCDYRIIDGKEMNHQMDISVKTP